MEMTVEGWIKPNYGDRERAGSTIANIPATIAKWFDVPFDGLNPLGDELWSPLVNTDPIERVVLILIDGMGANYFDGPLSADINGWAAEYETINQTITSVFPSTTVNALTCLWTGFAPGQHSLVGIKMLFPELGTIGHMLTLSSVASRRKDELIPNGIDPETFLPVPGIAQQFAKAGIPTYAVKPKAIVRSGLSRIHDRGVEQTLGSVSFSEMMWKTADLLNRNPGKPMYISDYMPTVDTLAHHHGWDHTVTLAEAQTLLSQIKTGLIDQLTPEGRKGTVVVVTADHGQMKIDRSSAIFQDEIPELDQLLLIDGAGEPRTPYLYARQGRLDQLVSLAEKRFHDQILLKPARTVIDEGWLGPDRIHDNTELRIGDMVGFMKKDATYIPTMDRWIFDEFIGMHGGLLPDEMRVPFWAVRLG